MNDKVVTILLMIFGGGGGMLAQGYFMGRTSNGQGRPLQMPNLADKGRRRPRRYVRQNLWALLLGLLGLLMIAAGLLLGQSFGPEYSLPTLGSLVLVVSLALLWREYVNRSRR